MFYKNCPLHHLLIHDFTCLVKFYTSLEKTKRKKNARQPSKNFSECGLIIWQMLTYKWKLDGLILKIYEAKNQILHGIQETKIFWENFIRNRYLYVYYFILERHYEQSTYWHINMKLLFAAYCFIYGWKKKQKVWNN